jgi:hypothetical protein
LDAGAVGVVAAGTGGLQFLQAPYLAAACDSGIGIELRRRELHPARWYFAPVLVT